MQNEGWKVLDRVLHRCHREKIMKHTPNSSMLFCLVIVITLALAQFCSAQEALISGRVMRKGHVPMAAAQVTYIQQATGWEFSTTTGADGIYRLEHIPLTNADPHTPQRSQDFEFFVTNTVGSSQNFFLQGAMPQSKIIIFNILGRQVAELGLTGANGFYSAHWDGCASGGIPVADGVYFATTVTASGLHSLKLVHLAHGPVAMPQNMNHASILQGRKPQRQSHALDETLFTVRLEHDAVGGRFADTTFMRTLNEGDNGFVIDSVAALPVERILFIGNSYTYFNGGVDEVLRNLVLSADSNAVIETGNISAGGYTLEDHWNTESTRAAIQTSHYDLVILQEQSTRPVEEPELMYTYATLLDSIIINNGKDTGFFMTWGRQNRPQMIDSLAAAYEHIGNQLQALVNPVGRAFQRVNENHPSINLYIDDGSHPSVWGTYLACCVFYAKIWNTSPVGIQYVNDPSITNEDRAYLQTVAWEVVNQ
jgi:hypothetical protein